MGFNFAEAVTEKFIFLEDLGFSQVEALPTIVQYRKDGIQVNIYHGRKSCELGFEIVRLGERYSIPELIRITNPEAAARYRNATATKQNSLTSGLARLEELVRRYGNRALRGDPEFFVALDNQRRAWAQAYALEVLERQLRPKADEAFRLGNYREAAEIYERILPHLSPAELRKLSVAKKCSGG
jgi:tetratricopeptide (TPR) repeat protein